MICLVSTRTGLGRISFFEKKKVIAMNFGSLSHNCFLQPIHILYNNLHAMCIATIPLPLPPKKLVHCDNFTTLKVLFYSSKSADSSATVFISHRRWRCCDFPQNPKYFAYNFWYMSILRVMIAVVSIENLDVKSSEIF